jgi:mannose-6-phosphate isomerase
MPREEEQLRGASIGNPGFIQSVSISDNELPTTGLRPWGSFTTLEEGKGYRVRRVEIKPGHRLSLQMHHHCSKSVAIVSGTSNVILGTQKFLLTSSQSIQIPLCTVYRIENVGLIPLVFIETQTGEYLGEDDIIRFQDDYARTTSPERQNMTISGQGNLIPNEEEIVISCLKNNRYDFRTITGIAQETGISRDRVEQILERSNSVRKSLAHAKNGENLYADKRKKISIQEFLSISQEILSKPFIE